MINNSRKKKQPVKKMHVKKGDKVIVISGKSKGKSGKILVVDRHKRTVVIEGVNIIKRHQRPTQKISKGGIIEKEGPIRLDKVMLIDPSTKQRTRVGYDKVAGKSVRVAKKSGEMIDQA